MSEKESAYQKNINNHRINSDGLIERKCTACNEWKIEEEDNFYRINKSKSEMRFMAECKKCISKRSRHWALKNPERKRELDLKVNKNENRREFYKERSRKKRENGSRKKWEQENKNRILQYNRDRQQNKRHEISTKEWKDCLKYFNHSCTYCGITEDEHLEKYKQRLHKEHVEHNGSNKLDNCIPSCRICNSSKNTMDFEEWYKIFSKTFTQERYNKIIKWLMDDYKSFIKIQ